MSTREVYCPAMKLYFDMKGSITDLGTGLQEFHIKSCENEPCCTFMNQEGCRVREVLQAGKW